MTELIPFTKTLTLPEPVPEPGRMMTFAAASEPEPAPEQVPSIWALQAQAIAELLAEMQAAGYPAEESWIRSSIHRVGSTVDTVRAVGILPAGAPARFAGGPLDGQSMPSELEPAEGQMPRLTRPDGSYYELVDIDYAAGEYRYAFTSPADQPFNWGMGYGG